jgi:fructose-bisphosphate aldolase class II
MIINTSKILEFARENKYAIPHFNINNLEWTRFILEECNKNNSPVILGVTESSIEYMGGYKVVVDIINDLINSLDIKIPVVIHLDHGSSFTSCKNAIDSGFTSVMIDASKYPFLENVEITKKVVEYAHLKNVTVEAELGILSNELNYTDVQELKEFINLTNIDSVAPSIGNAHGIYHGPINIDINRIKEMSKFNIPLVLHGGSGIPNEIIKETIKNGICKINFNTDLQIAWSNELRNYLKNNSEYDPRKIIKSGEEAMKKIISEKIELLESNNRR